MKWAETLYWKCVEPTRLGRFRDAYKPVGLVFGPGLRLWPFKWRLCLLKDEAPLYRVQRSVLPQDLDFREVEIVGFGPRGQVRPSSVRVKINGVEVPRARRR